MPRIVPVIINALQDPMPTVRRSIELGRLIAQAIESYPDDTRVAVLGTGGLSHSIGEPTMGDAVAYGAAGDNADFALIDYMACPEVYVGCAFGAWVPREALVPA